MLLGVSHRWRRLLIHTCANCQLKQVKLCIWRSWMQRNRKYLAHVEKAMGVMLILFAVLIATNTVNRVAQLMIEWVPAFGSFG